MPERNAPEVDARTVRVLEAALSAVHLLQLKWRRSVEPVVSADGDYPPETVDWILREWEALAIAAEGGTVSYAGGAGGGTHDRLALATMLADVERATDVALADRWHWRTVQRIYLKQGRPLDPLELGAFLRNNRHLVQADREPPWPFSWWLAIELICRRLDWRGYLRQPQDEQAAA